MSLVTGKCIDVFYAHKSQQGGQAVDWSFLLISVLCSQKWEMILSKCDRLQGVNRYSGEVQETNSHCVSIKMQGAIPI